MILFAKRIIVFLHLVFRFRRLYLADYWNIADGCVNLNETE